MKRLLAPYRPKVLIPEKKAKELSKLLLVLSEGKEKSWAGGAGEGEGQEAEVTYGAQDKFPALHIFADSAFWNF